MVARNGGTAGSDGDAWEQHPFYDESENKPLARLTTWFQLGIIGYAISSEYPWTLRGLEIW